MTKRNPSINFDYFKLFSAFSIRAPNRRFYNTKFYYDMAEFSYVSQAHSEFYFPIVQL